MAALRSARGIQYRTDTLSLQGMVELLQEDRFGLTPEPYSSGYEHGFLNTSFAPTSWDTTSREFTLYKRGRKAGRDAYWRGAHHGAHEEKGTA